MQNLITQLLQPDANMTGPTTLQRRAAEALIQLTQRAHIDTERRLVAEKEAADNLAMAEVLRGRLVNSNHEEAYREVMNEDYRLNFT